ncbi:hypothetical protein AKO1_004058, partial [Acrasis kona]
MQDLFMDDRTRTDYNKMKQAKEMYKVEQMKKGILTPQNEENIFQKRATTVELISRIKTLESENTILRKQSERSSNELKDAQAAMALLKEDVSGKRRTDIKNRETFIRKLTVKVNKLNQSITHRENNFVFQQQLVKSLTQKKNILHQQNSALTTKLLHQSDMVARLKSKMELQASSLKVMNEISSSLICQFMSRIAPDTDVQGHHVVKILYRDLFKTYIIAMNAAIKIQSWFRGVISRRKLLKNGFYIIASQNKREGKNHHFPHSKAPQNLNVVVNIAKKSSKPLREILPQGKLPKNKRDLESFDMMRQFLDVIMASSNQTKKLSNLGQLLLIVKDEILEWLRTETSQELEKMKKEIEVFSENIVRVVRAASEKPYTTRSTQTTQTEVKEKGIQCGITNVSRVEI